MHLLCPRPSKITLTRHVRPNKTVSVSNIIHLEFLDLADFHDCIIIPEVVSFVAGRLRFLLFGEPMFTIRGYFESFADPLNSLADPLNSFACQRQNGKLSRFPSVVVNLIFRLSHAD